MKKILFILLINLILSGSVFADNHCNENRKDWIKQLKRDLANDIGDVIYSNNQCYVEIIEHNGMTMKE